MSKTDELLEEMLEDVEEYATPVTDDDLQFWIDEHLRVISIPKNGVVAGVEGDKNVNKIKFGMNRYYHDFDMSTFSGRILYSNAKGNKNYYNITDMQASGSIITFSWLVDADAVQYMGKTSFVVYLFKIQGSELRQKFFSTLATLKVLEGMEVDSAVPVEKQTDIIERMKEEISAYAEEVKKSLPADYTAMTEQVGSLKEDLGDYANSGLISIARVNTFSKNETNSFAVNLKANTMYLLDTVFDGSGAYSVSFYDSDNTIIDTILNLSEASEKKIFYLKKDATKMNVFRNSLTDTLNLNVYSYDTVLYNLQSTVVLKDYAKQYADGVEYIVDIKKGDIVTVTVNTDRLSSTTARLFNTDVFSPSEPTNLVLWDNIPQINDKSYTLIADKDYKFIRIYKTIGILTLKVEKEKQHKDNQVKLNFVNGVYYPEGQIGQEVENRVAPQTLGGNGLFLVTFPDTMICHYYVNGDGIDTETPFSIYGNHDLHIYFKSKDESKPISTDSDLSGIKIWYIDKPHADEDIIVSASDSKDAYKQISDIVCDGTNDTDVLSALIGSYNSINIKLMDGTYNINKAWKTSNNAKVSLSLNEDLLSYDGSSRRRYITMRGKHKTSPLDFEGVKLVVSEELHNSFDNSTNNIILGAGYDKSKEVGRIACSVNFENFNIIGFKYDKPITYVDTTRCLSTMINSVNIHSWGAKLLEYTAFENTPNEECCGMRVGRGSNYGIQNYVKHSNIWYCGKGLACNGEHFIFEDVKLHHDYNAIVLGDRKTVGSFEHANIFIGCAIEACYRLGLLSKNGITEFQDFVTDYANRLQSSTLIMIGTSTETTWFIPTNEIIDDKTSQTTLPFIEILRGCYRGRIEMDWWSSPFANDGSGKRMNYISYDGNHNTYRSDVK